MTLSPYALSLAEDCVHARERGNVEQQKAMIEEECAVWEISQDELRQLYDILSHDE